MCITSVENIVGLSTAGLRSLTVEGRNFVYQAASHAGCAGVPAQAAPPNNHAPTSPDRSTRTDREGSLPIPLRVRNSVPLPGGHPRCEPEGSFTRGAPASESGILATYGRRPSMSTTGGEWWVISGLSAPGWRCGKIWSGSLGSGVRGRTQLWASSTARPACGGSK